MGYLHIDNLYKAEAQTILLFRECYALEKIHGTSAHLLWKDGTLRASPGGCKLADFLAFFDGAEAPALASVSSLMAEKFGERRVCIYGEAYGGKCQGMRKTYGDRLRFVVFDVRVEDCWLAVPSAEELTQSLGLQFVSYRKTPTDLAALDAERDSPSEQARRNGIAEDRPREGVVLRPLVELTDNRGERVIAKHKREEFRERKSIPEVDPTKREILSRAEAIAEEWVTDMRLTHVLDKLGNPLDVRMTGEVIKAMVEDVCREASGEIVDSHAARKAIGHLACKLYKARLRTVAPEVEP